MSFSEAGKHTPTLPYNKSHSVTIPQFSVRGSRASTTRKASGVEGEECVMTVRPARRRSTGWPLIFSNTRVRDKPICPCCFSPTHGRLICAGILDRRFCCATGQYGRWTAHNRPVRSLQTQRQHLVGKYAWNQVQLCDLFVIRLSCFSRYMTFLWFICLIVCWKRMKIDRAIAARAEWYR